MAYCTEDDVYGATGLDTTIVQRLSGLGAAAVTTLIGGFITEAQNYVDEMLGIPTVVHMECHVGDGEKDEFDLGAEDELGFYNLYTPEDNTVMGYAAWLGGEKRIRPYPTDSDQTESIASSCAGLNATITNDTSVVGAGSNSTKTVFSAAGYVEYPSTQDLNKNIDVFTYLSMRVRCSSATVIITVRLYDKDGNYNYISFSVDKANKMYVRSFDLDDFTGAIDWDDTSLYYWRVYVDGACDLYLDNLNFNDEWFITAPQDKLVIAHSDGDEPPPYGFSMAISYSVNPFLSAVPANIKTATENWAGVKLVDYMIGRRQRDTAFLVEGATLITNIDKETLYHTRSRLITEAKRAMSAYGYGFEFVPVQA